MLNVIKLFDDLLLNAVEKKASDIHIEPSENCIRIRFRIDGLLVLHDNLPKDIFSLFASRIKVLASMDTSQNRLPQDGRVSIGDLDLRVSSLPTIFGEKIVIRILNKNKLILNLTELGMNKEDVNKYNKLIQSSHGLILVVGPTGCGKTTTLYSSLKNIISLSKNITTVEDPIEYYLDQVNQVQINEKSGLDFPVALKSILRQDPDVILIGEIRDLQTAKIAVRASLTGHLVLSTLHTGTAVGAITRMLDMGIPSYLLAAALKGIVSQRLLKIKTTGRVGVFELLIVNDDIKEAIRNKVAENHIEKLAGKEGLCSLKGQILEKIENGIVLEEDGFSVI